MSKWIRLGLLSMGLLCACEDEFEEDCTEETYQCDGDILLVCLDAGWEEEVDCSAEGQYCVETADDADCMDDSQSTR